MLLGNVQRLLELPGEHSGGANVANLTSLHHVMQCYTVLRTDRNGWIELTTDGQQMWVEVER
jgi:hypothetical protein